MSSIIGMTYTPFYRCRFDKELAEGEDNETTTKPAEAEAEADEDKNEVCYSSHEFVIV